MPLRDHSRPPVSARHSWDAFHAMWPGDIVRHLFGKLPPGYAAAPGVHLGGFEVDVSAHEEDASFPANDAPGGAATATRTARSRPRPWPPTCRTRMSTRC